MSMIEGVITDYENTYVRIHESDKNMRYTFNECLYRITGHEFNRNDWTNGRPCIPDLDEKHYCICGHIIHNLYYIKYIPTGIQVQVGCDCVKKIDRDLYKKITSDTFCDFCKVEPIGKKTKINKDGFCSEVCKLTNKVGSWRCFLRKYRDLDYTYNYVLEKDKGYLQWFITKDIPFTTNEVNNKLIKQYVLKKLSEVA